jgi:hypothetical protein
LGTDPQEVRVFRQQVMAEYLRVEFPFRLEHLDPATFPQNNSPPLNTLLPPLQRPQIAARYEYKVAGASATHESAELLYAILSLSFDEFGQPLSAVLREREIADTDGDGVKEVLDAFGDPLLFSLLVKLDEQDLADVASVDPSNIVQNDLADAIGYEVILDRSLPLQPGQVRGPWPIEKYRLTIRSANLSSTDSGAVVTQ